MDGFTGFTPATTEEHVEVEVTWRIHQRMITAYRAPTGPWPS